MEEENRDRVAEAIAAAERIEAANKVQAEQIKKLEAMQTRNILGGQSSAGEPQKPEMTAEEKMKADMIKYFKGTAIEKALK